MKQKSSLIKRYLTGIGISVLIIGITVFVVKYLQDNKKVIKPKKSQENIAQVKVIKIKRGIYRPEQQLYAELNTEKVVKITAYTNGEVAKLPVVSGQIVKAGSLLFELSVVDFGTAINRSKERINQTNLDITQADKDLQNFKRLLIYEQQLLNLQKKQLDRIKRLAADNNSSLRDLEAAEEGYVNRQVAVLNRQKQIDDIGLKRKRLQAQLRSQRTELQDVQLNLKRSRSVSPTSALILKVNTSKGERVSVNSTLIELLPIDNVEFTAVLLNRQLPMIIESIENKHKLKAHIDVYGKQLETNLIRLQGQSNGSGQVGVFKLVNPQTADLLRLRPNISMPMSMLLAEIPGAIALPFTALYGTNKVFLLEENRLKSIKVNFMGTVLGTDGEHQALITSSELPQGSQVMITHLPSAVTGLQVIAVD